MTASQENPAAAVDGPRVQRLLALVLLLGTVAFMAFNAVIGIIARDLGVPEWQIGLVVTASGLAIMATGRYWGRESDARGRRAVLRRGAIGNVVGFVVLAAFVAWAWSQRPEPWLVFAGLILIRIGTSVYYSAVQPAAQAFVADVTTPAERARGMALLGLGSAAGMVMGPAMASAMAPFGVSWPLWGAAIVAGVAFAATMLIPAGAAPRPRADTPPLALGDPRLRFPMAVGFCAMVCVMSAQVTTGFFAQDHFGLSTPAAASLAGGALTSVGAALVAAAIAVRRTGWPPTRLILVGAPIAAIGFGSAALVTAPWQMVAGYFCAGFGMGFIFPAFQASASMAVSDAEQGAALGAVAMAQALGMTLGPIVATTLYRGVGRSAPFVFSALLLLGIAAAVVAARGRGTVAPAADSV